MDLSLRQAAETLTYRHKKFDKRKRVQDEDSAQELEVASTSRSSPAAHFLFNTQFYGVERISTPLSNDSNGSSDYAAFMAVFPTSSTPSSKRRRLISGGQYAASPSEDSGISLTPQKQLKGVQQAPRHLKRSLKPSALAKPPPAGISTIPTNKINNKAMKRRISNINIPNASVSTTIKSGIKVDVNSIKAALKPTPVGTLALSSVSDDITAPSRSLPAASATVLSRISEDKLRSICTYHGNMVRNFPKKQRSPKDQERRNKNTIACRMSRRIKKLEQIAIDEQCKEFEQQHSAILEEMLRGMALLEQLNQLEKESRGVEDEPEIDVVSVDDVCCGPVRNDWKFNTSAEVVPKTQMTTEPPALTVPRVPTIANAFSIAYLIGNY